MSTTKSKKYTSHSRLCELLRLILGLPDFPTNAEFMHFGFELHAQGLEGKSKGVKLTRKQKAMLKAMLISLEKNKLWKWLKSVCEVEVEYYGELHKTMIKAYLDLYSKSLGVLGDLKTTNCETYEQFVAKAFMYGYFRQAVIYMAITGAKEFYFIGIQKPKETPKSTPQKPLFFEPKVFELNVKDYPMLMAYARQEVEFLLYYFNKYGHSMLKPKIKLNEAA